jgi:hypothetical protein
VNWDGQDPREEANSERSVINAGVFRELQALMRMFRSCNIDVIIDQADQTNAEAEPQGGLVDVVRWVQPEGYLVRLNRDLSPADRVHCLDWAWRSMRPSIAQWDRCTIEADLDGQLFQRIYNNERETGIYQPS